MLKQSYLYILVLCNARLSKYTDANVQLLFDFSPLVFCIVLHVQECE